LGEYNGEILKVITVKCKCNSVIVPVEKSGANIPVIYTDTEKYSVKCRIEPGQRKYYMH
jgi:hypothetical protein